MEEEIRTSLNDTGHDLQKKRTREEKQSQEEERGGMAEEETKIKG